MSESNALAEKLGGIVIHLEDAIEAAQASAAKAEANAARSADRNERVLSALTDAAARIEGLADARATSVASAASERLNRACEQAEASVKRIADGLNATEKAYRRWPLRLILTIVVLGALNGWLAWGVAEKVAEGDSQSRRNEALAEKFSDQLRIVTALEANGASLECARGECVVTLSGKIQTTKTDGKVRIVLPIVLPIAKNNGAP